HQTARAGAIQSHRRRHERDSRPAGWCENRGRNGNGLAAVRQRSLLFLAADQAGSGNNLLDSYGFAQHPVPNNLKPNPKITITAQEAFLSCLLNKKIKQFIIPDVALQVVAYVYFANSGWGSGKNQVAFF